MRRRAGKVCLRHRLAFKWCDTMRASQHGIALKNFGTVAVTHVTTCDRSISSPSTGLNTRPVSYYLLEPV